MTTMIERVARAIETLDREGQQYPTHYEGLARAASDIVIEECARVAGNTKSLGVYHPDIAAAIRALKEEE